MKTLTTIVIITISILLTISVLPLNSLADEYKIGVLLETKKDGLQKTTYSSTFYKAIELAYLDYKSRLDKAGIKTSIKLYYLEEDPIKAYHVVKKAIHEGVDVILGPSVSYYIPGVVLGIQETDVPIITPYASTNRIKNSKNILNLALLDRDMIRALENFANDRFANKKCLIVCALDVEESFSACSSFSKNFLSRTNFFKTDVNVSNIKKIVDVVKQNKINLVISPNRIPISAPVIKALLEEGYKGQFLGTSAVGEVVETGLLHLVGNQDFEMFMIREFSVHNLHYETKFKRVVQELTEANGHPRLISLLYYDATALLLEHLLKKPKSLKAALQNDIGFKGILFDQNRKNKKFNVIQLKNGLYKHFVEIRL